MVVAVGQLQAVALLPVALTFLLLALLLIWGLAVVVVVGQRQVLLSIRRRLLLPQLRAMAVVVVVGAGQLPNHPLCLQPSHRFRAMREEAAAVAQRLSIRRQRLLLLPRERLFLEFPQFPVLLPGRR